MNENGGKCVSFLLNGRTNRIVVDYDAYEIHTEKTDNRRKWRKLK